MSGHHAPLSLVLLGDADAPLTAASGTDLRRRTLPRVVRARLITVVLIAGLLGGACGSDRSPVPRSARTTAPSAARVASLRHERVLFIGDSLMGFAQKPLKKRLRTLGVPNLVVSRPGSGLINSVLWDWLLESRRLEQSYHPTVVVAEFCCNYELPYVKDATGRAIGPASPDFPALWQKRAEVVIEHLTRRGAQLYWVITPPSQDEGVNRALIERINDVMRRLAARKKPPIHLIDWEDVLTGGTRRFQPILSVDGKDVQVRKSDGLHFTPAGAQLAADSLVDSLLSDNDRGSTKPR